MKYTIYVLTFIIVLVGGYLTLAPQAARNFNVVEEETARTCKMKIVMYSSPYCRYCVLAKELLQGHNLIFTEIDVFKDQTEAQNLIKRTGRASVPQIFINDLYIGGYSELNNLKITGKLKQFLKTCDVVDLE